MLNTSITGKGMRLVVAAAVTLLLALAALAAQASPAFAAETLTVTKTGSGTVTSNPEGINCGDDCSEPYPSSTEQVCINRTCRDVTTYQDVTLSASPAPGWAFQSWSGDCSGTSTSCTVTVIGDESVHATFNRISPPNDDFAAAQLISGATTSASGTTKDATMEPREPHHVSGWPGDHTVWYSWTAPHTGDWDLDTCQANIDSILAVYIGDQLGALTKVKDNNNGCSSGFGSKLTFRAQKDQTYRIVVGDAGGTRENTFTLALKAIPAPSNDNFANAQVINGAGASVNGTNVSATREYSDPWSGVGERSVWYAWTAPFSGSATLDTCAANYDSLLGVSISRWWGLEEVAKANNGCSSGFGDKLTFNAQNGQTYYIGVDGCCGAPAGTFTLALNLVDDVLPETTIHSGPEDGSAGNDPSPTFTFDSSETESDFECRLYPSDLTQPAFRACSDGSMHTPQTDLDPGTYTFQVRATDPRGNLDETPAKRTFTVDTTQPTLNITDGPNNGQTFGPGSTQTWNFAASDALSGVQSVQCKVELNGSPAAYGPCSGGTTSHSVSNLPAGSHKFYARATDKAGNLTPEQTRSFSIVLPSLRISDMRISERSRTAHFTVQLSAASQQTTTVNYATVNGTAKAPADYATRRGTLTFLPGQTVQGIAVPIRNDRKNERNETFFVRLLGQTNATIADSSGTGTIVDND